MKIRILFFLLENERIEVTNPLIRHEFKDFVLKWFIDDHELKPIYEFLP